MLTPVIRGEWGEGIILSVSVSNIFEKLLHLGDPLALSIVLHFKTTPYYHYYNHMAKKFYFTIVVRLESI